MAEELIQIVDENDKPIAAATKEEAWNKGLTHRVARIMVEDKDGRVLLQKRSMRQPLFPGTWDNSAAGHVDENETYDHAARRELSEEIGIDLPLKKVGYYFVDFRWNNFHLKRFAKSYKVIVEADIPLKLQQSEVTATKWFTVKEVKQLIQDHPEQVSDGLKQVFERFY